MFLVSNWNTYIFCGISIIAGLAVVRIAKKSKNILVSINDNTEENEELASYNSSSNTPQNSRDKRDVDNTTPRIT